MKKSMNEIMVRTIVKKAIRDFKTDPERTIRNLVDMALQFSDSAFQQEFYSAAQRLLSDEKSGYYDLVKDTITRVNEETLLTFSMNLGYNGLYLGAKRIRETADCHIQRCLHHGTVYRLGQSCGQTKDIAPVLPACRRINLGCIVKRKPSKLILL